MGSDTWPHTVEDPFIREVLEALDAAGSIVTVPQLKRIFQNNGVLVPTSTKLGQAVNTTLSEDVSVREGVIPAWTWASARLILGSQGTPVHLLYARHMPALRQLVSEHAAFRRTGAHRSVLGALGWHVDTKGGHLLDSVALVVPAVAQTVEACVYCDGGELASRRLLVETRADVVLDLCDALQSLRGAGLVLLDLTAANVALGDCTRDAFTAAVVSLKHAYPVGHVLTEDDVCALAAVYTAPAVAAGDVVQAGMDCWALGVAMWELVMGFQPVNGVQPRRGGRGWLFAADAVTDSVTHDTLTMLLLPAAEAPCSPVEVHQWMQKLKAQVASDEYQEMAAALADGAEAPPPADLTSSGGLRREECLAAASAHVGEARNGALLAEYHAERIGTMLSSLVVASPRACREVARAASLPDGQPRWRRWARGAARAMKPVNVAPAVATAALVLATLVTIKKA